MRLGGGRSRRDIEGLSEGPPKELNQAIRHLKERTGRGNKKKKRGTALMLYQPGNQGRGGEKK